jgi:hypothetical protein
VHRKIADLDLAVLDRGFAQLNLPDGIDRIARMFGVRRVAGFFSGAGWIGARLGRTRRYTIPIMDTSTVVE